MYVTKTDLAATRASLRSAAESLALGLEEAGESPRVLSTRLTLTVTGEPEQIEIFRQMFEGDGWQSGGGDDVVGFLVNPVIGAVLGAAQRMRSSRRRIRKRRASSGSDDDVGSSGG